MIGSLSRSQYLGFGLTAGIVALCAYALHQWQITIAMIWFFAYVALVVAALVTSSRDE